MCIKDINFYLITDIIDGKDHLSQDMQFTMRHIRFSKLFDGYSATYALISMKRCMLLHHVSLFYK